MDYKMIITDLDDTLVNSQGTISPEDKKAIIDIQKKGVKFVLCSGRPTFAMMDLAKELDLETYGGYVLSFNGSIIFDCKEKKIIKEVGLTPEEIHFIYDIARRENVEIITYVGDSIVSEDFSEYINEEVKITKMNFEKVENFKERVDVPCTKCILLAEPSYLEKVEKKLQKELGDKFSIARSKSFFLEVTKLGIDKGMGIKTLCSITNTPIEKTIAVGDSYNDIPMLKVAGLSVAVANAKPEILEMVDFISKSNNENGMAFMIDNILKK